MVNKDNCNEYKFSVSICVYGGDNAEYFDIALASIFEQTLMPDEVVLVVDGPVGEDIDSIIEKYDKQYDILKVIRLQVNSGHGIARDTALKNCSYELIALMDADDISADNRFEKQIEKFKEDESLSIVGGQIEEFIGDKNNIVGKRTVPLVDEDIKRYMQKRCPMNQVTVMMKKSQIDEVGGYIDWYCEEDYYLWIRMMLKNKKFANTSDNLVYVRVGNDMYQRRGGIKYFKSEAGIQKYMLKHKIISFPRYIINVTERLVLQVLMPNSIRGWIFKTFARE